MTRTLVTPRRRCQDGVKIFVRGVEFAFRAWSRVGEWTDRCPVTTAHRIRPTCTSDIALSARGVVILPVDDVRAPCHEAVVRARCFGRMIRAVHVCPLGADHQDLRRIWHGEHPLVDLVVLDAGPGESPAAVLTDWVSVMSSVDDLLVVLADGSRESETRAVSVGLAVRLSRAFAANPATLVAHMHTA
jgi:hypothetical protein